MRSRDPELSEAFSHQGYWWIDGDESHKVGGLFKYDAQDGGLLETWGSISRREFSEEPIAIIRGITQNARHVTLLESRPHGHHFQQGTFIIHSLRCQYALIGNYFPPANSTYWGCNFHFTVSKTGREDRL